jgi:hypothetical protein
MTHTDRNISDPKLDTNKSISDPEVFGPGMWYSIHSSSIQLDDECFMKYIDGIIPKIPCLICREHATEYLKNNPTKDYKGIKNSNGEYIGMFKWSWIFHNTVNKRLGKPILDWDTAYNMFTDDSKVCSMSCGN